MLLSLRLVALAALVGARPRIAQQVTWFYANSLDAGAAFLGDVVNFTQVLDQGPCRIFRAAPEGFLGVCDSRAAPADGPPPVTYTLVVPDRDAVDEWHEYLAARAPRVNVTQPSESSTFNCYAFNFYDPDPVTSLGFYRFEVQAFLDGEWPAPTCPEIR